MPVAEPRTSPQIQASNHMDILTALTMQSSPSWSSSPLPLLSPLSSGDDSSTNKSPERLPRLPIRKRPRIYDLRHYQSTPFVPSQSASTPTSGLRQEAPPQYSPVRGRRQRQCVNADSPNRARNWFASPDRFLSSRSPPSPESPVQLGRAVPTLRPRERYTRRRDDSINPFRSDSSLSSRSVATQRPINPTHRVSPPQYTPSFVHVTDALPREIGTGAPPIAPRQISAGAVWNVGGQATAQITLPRAADGQGGLFSSGTHAPLHIAHFLDHDTPDQDLRRHEDCVALALGVDPATRILLNIRTKPSLDPDDSAGIRSYNWRNNAWTWGDFQKFADFIHLAPKPNSHAAPRSRPTSNRNVSAIPFRVLDAPHIRDDYDCSILAYSYTARTLAVAVGSHVYIWTEEKGIQNPPLMPCRLQNYVTSVSFSSTNGGRAILAVSRQNGQVTLWSVLEQRVRHEIGHENSVSCVSFRPTFTYRASTNMRLPRVACEDLLVGDDLGDVYYYSIEWPDPALRRVSPNWTRTVTVLAKISAHSERICGLAWSPDNMYFVTGGNDNAALLFEISKILRINGERGRTRYRAQAKHHEEVIITTPYQRPSNTDLVRGWNRFSEGEVQLGDSGITTPRRHPRPTISSDPIFHFGMREPHPPRDPHTPTHPSGMHSRLFLHSAAVKALAFAPWQPSLLATGGGSNDRQIHFFHTGTAAILALINVFAQVTSLIWSTTKREICATFGYAQPEHKVRIAVFAWPDCECVISIPWESKIMEREVPRALWAIKFPGRPNGQGDAEARGRRNTNRNVSVRRRWSREGEIWASRTEEEGCIIVVGSDGSIKFHEVWAGEKKGGLRGKGLGNVRGVFGRSRILEGLFEGIEVVEAEKREVVR